MSWWKEGRYSELRATVFFSSPRTSEVHRSGRSELACLHCHLHFCPLSGSTVILYCKLPLKVTEKLHMLKKIGYCNVKIL